MWRLLLKRQEEKEKNGPVIDSAIIRATIVSYGSADGYAVPFWLRGTRESGRAHARHLNVAFCRAQHSPVRVPVSFPRGGPQRRQ